MLHFLFLILFLETNFSFLENFFGLFDLFLGFPFIVVKYVVNDKDIQLYRTLHCWQCRVDRQREHIIIMEQILLASKIVSMLCLGLLTWIIGIVPLVSVRRGITLKSYELLDSWTLTFSSSTQIVHLHLQGGWVRRRVTAIPASSSSSHASCASGAASSWPPASATCSPMSRMYEAMLFSSSYNSKT